MWQEEATLQPIPTVASDLMDGGKAVTIRNKTMDSAMPLTWLALTGNSRHKEWWHHQPRNAQDWFITPEPPIQIDWAGIIQYVKDLGYRVALSPLRKGSHGEEVRAAQQRLNGLGFNVGVVDGRFGRKTKRGVKGFQRAMPPLVVDGVIGGKTWQRMWGSNRP